MQRSFEEHILRQVHGLTARADNRLDEHAFPVPKVDWYHRGGITRSVFAESLKGICVLNNRLVLFHPCGLAGEDRESSVSAAGNLAWIGQEAIITRRYSMSTVSPKWLIML